MNKYNVEFSDEELTMIYNKANGLMDGKRLPITTKRIFTAMRFIAQLPKETEGGSNEGGQDILQGGLQIPIHS